VWKPVEGQTAMRIWLREKKRWEGAGRWPKARRCGAGMREAGGGGI